MNTEVLEAPVTQEPVVDPAQAQVEVPPQEGAAQAESEEQQAKPVKDPVQKRFDQLTWQKHEADRRANAQAIENQRLQQQLAQLQRERLEIHRRVTMPTLEQANMDPRVYERALDEHNQRYYNAQREAEQQTLRELQINQAAQQFTNFVESRIAEAVQKYPDYESVVTSENLPPLGKVNPPLFQAIMNHEQMPEITYFLGKNPAEAHRIARLPPPLALIELGKISGRITPRSPGNAPAPPATVGSNQRAGSDAPRDSDSIETWMRKRNAQLAKQR